VRTCVTNRGNKCSVGHVLSDRGKESEVSSLMLETLVIKLEWDIGERIQRGG
jgi:hypothetical protein